MDTESDNKFSDHLPHYVNSDDVLLCSICDSKPYNHKPLDPNGLY